MAVILEAFRLGVEVRKLRTFVTYDDEHSYTVYTKLLGDGREKVTRLVTPEGHVADLNEYRAVPFYAPSLITDAGYKAVFVYFSDFRMMFINQNHTQLIQELINPENRNLLLAARDLETAKKLLKFAIT